jgi:hypothetical protein
MLADLVRRGQLECWNIPVEIAKLAEAQGHEAEDVQAIIAELLDPAFDFRTPRAIAKATHLPEQSVGYILEALSEPTVPARLRTWQDDGAYTFWNRRPGFFGRLRLVKRVIRWWNAPNIS